MKEEEKPRDDMIRQLNDLAVRSSRNRQSKQTGYIHLCYHPEEEERHDTIPLTENFLFALALLQSRTSENILEARAILERLLNFQASDGNFPVYLHEYPNCRDRCVGANILPALYWMLKIFHGVLGSDFHPKLRKATQALLQHSLQSLREKAFPEHLTIKLAAAAKGLGDLWNMPEVAKEGSDILAKLSDSTENTSWYSPASIADILTGLQIVYPSISNSPWKNFWKHLNSSWHQTTGAYSGAPLREFQQGFEPQPTLYDLYLGYLSGSLSQRALIDNPFHIHAALISPTMDRLTEIHYPVDVHGKIGDCNWLMFQNDAFAYSLLDQHEPGRLCHDRGRHIMRLLWGDSKRVHTLTCQGGNSAETTFSANENRVELFFHLTETVASDDREKNREITLFFDLNDDAEIIVQDVAATTFQMQDQVIIRTGGLQFTMMFTLEEGQGQFFGHVMPGNRPSQLSLKGPQRFNAYDWQFFLRTVRRTEPCKIKLEISVDCP